MRVADLHGIPKTSLKLCEQILAEDLLPVDELRARVAAYRSEVESRMGKSGLFDASRDLYL